MDELPIESKWVELWGHLRPTVSHLVDEHELRKVFYAGAWAVFNRLNSAGCLNSEADGPLIKAIGRECAEFKSQMIRDDLGKN